jgi:hypothetical protein
MFGYFFFTVTVTYALTWTKNGLGLHFGRFFSQIHLVTLALRQFWEMPYIGVYHPLVSPPTIRPGLPDFFDTVYQNGEIGIYQITTKLQIGHKIHQMAGKCSKWLKNIPTISVPKPLKIYPNWNFWFENKSSGNPASDLHSWESVPLDELFCLHKTKNSQKNNCSTKDNL